MKQKPGPRKVPPRRRRVSRTLIIVLAAVFFAAASLILFFVLRNSMGNPVIAFYAVPEPVVRSITGLGELYFGEKEPPVIVMLDAALPLKPQIEKNRKIQLLFAPAGAASEELAGMTAARGQGILSVMPTAMRQTVIADGKVYALPVVLDHFEFAYRADMFNTAEDAEPAGMTEILERAEKIIAPPRRPFICAGAEDAELLLVTGSLTEAFLGFPAWKKLTEAMKQDMPFTEIIDTELTGGTFRDILNMLVSWKNEGLLHPEWIRMDNNTISHLMQENLAPSVFMLLSEHRKVPQRTIQQYTAMAIPPRDGGEVRGITAPAIIGMVFPRGKPEKTAEFLNSLVRQSAQRTLSTQTGLAPVNSVAEANDMQSSDVRFFAATAEMPITDIGTAAFTDPERRAAFAKEVRQFLLADGFGY